jgi:cysteine desulfurase/selenocysteine lyase
MALDRRQFLCSYAAAGLLARVVGAEQPARPAAAWPSPFPALNQRVNGHPLTFLDSAATTLRPQSVIDALVDYYSTDNANPSRAHTLASRAADRLAAARQTVARFVNAADPGEIIFVRGTTEGVNLVAATWGAETLRAGDEIVLTVAEHSSNLLPWTRLAKHAGASVRILDVDDEGRPRIDQLASARGW